MNQNYNPQGFQPYTGAQGQQGSQPMGGGVGHPVVGGAPSMGGMQGFPPSFSGGGTAGGFPGGTGGFGTTGGFPGGTGGAGAGAGGSVPGMLPIEQSYIENILRLNKGKLVHVFATFEGNNQWNAKEFVGVVEAAGRDHVILSDPQQGTRYLIPMVAVDYITFDEPIEYEYPFGAGPALSTVPPR